MLALKVPLKSAEKEKKSLLAKGLLDIGFKPAKDREFIYYPVKERFGSKFLFVEKALEKRKERVGLKESLGSKLAPQEMELLNTSMDITGTIAIIEVPDELKDREALIAEEVLRANKNVKTVLKKGKHEGVFRTQELKHLAGENTKVAEYRENGVVMKVDVEKVYFSPRLSYERLRIANLVKKGEEVLVMFSGCAPYVLVIAKNSEAGHIDGVEINPEGHKYALENLRLNKIKNASVFCGDVKTATPDKKYDRIIMPLPRTASEYLGLALAHAKKGATIHFYDFEKEAEVELGVKKIEEACKKSKRKFKLLGAFKTGQHEPRAFRYCYDFRVE